MKAYLFLFLLFSQFAKAQPIQYNVNGVAKNTDNLKYVYLVSTTLPEFFFVQPLTDSTFKFEGTTDLSGGFYKTAFLFFDIRGNITMDEVKSKVRMQGWALGRMPNVKEVVLEDVKLAVELLGKTFNFNITDGGILTKQYGELGIAKREKKKKDFILKYPDSPLSIAEIRFILYSFNIPMELGEKERRLGSPKELYPLLSERLRNSKEGIEILEKINEAYKR